MLEHLPSVKSVEKLLIGRSREIRSNKNRYNFWTQVLSLLALISMIKMSVANEDGSTDDTEEPAEDDLIANI